MNELAPIMVDRKTLAQELGLSRQRIGQLISDGKIPETDAGIDLEAAVTAYRAKTAPEKVAAARAAKLRSGALAVSPRVWAARQEEREKLPQMTRLIKALEGIEDRLLILTDQMLEPKRQRRASRRHSSVSGATP